MNAYLILENGSVFTGQSIGGDCERFGKIVFNTAMAGFTEILTNPVYDGQILCFTYPLVGNAGICFDDFVSAKPRAAALILSECSEIPSNFRSEMPFSAVPERYDIPVVTGIDTRSLVRLLRDRDEMGCLVSTRPERVENRQATLTEIAAWQPQAVLPDTGRYGKVYGPESGRPAALLDTGAPEPLIQRLTERGLRVRVYAPDTSADTLLADAPRGIILPPGPGNPNHYPRLTATVKALYASGIPLLAAGLGHQLLALATGAALVKLPHGHRGANYPVRDLETGRVFITTQHHGYTIDPNTLNPALCRLSHQNVNDSTVEGLQYISKKILSLQFLPDAYGMESIYDAFTAYMGEQ